MHLFLFFLRMHFISLSVQVMPNMHIGNDLITKLSFLFNVKQEIQRRKKGKKKIFFFFLKKQELPTIGLYPMAAIWTDHKQTSLS